MTYSFEFASVDGMRLKYTKEILEPVVKESLSMAQVLRKLGKRQSGGNHFHVKKVIEKLGIDTSNFTGKFWNNREENLNFRCPNCHSQTNNFSGRSSNSALMVE